MSNKLKGQTSAYLQKHENNAVYWYPWAEEAFELAKQKDKPLFISIGYFSCHWCNVMERESFTDSKTGQFMNKNFVNIKVDREEHPDIDKIYQRYYNSLTGESGGWPLSIWAFPDGLPFFIGTYFPKSFNLKSRTFMSINNEILESWKNERNELEKVAVGLLRNLDSSNKVILSPYKPLTDQLYKNEVAKLQRRFDFKNGGLDHRPKFPRFATMKFLLLESYRRNLIELTKFVSFTFNKMTLGGVYDQIGGGISRYSVDEKWLEPHYEKMLYDNAGLLKISADLYSLTKSEHVNYIIQDTISFLVREMRDPLGVFYSSVDAESENIEGNYYVWGYSEIKNILKEDFKIAKLRYGLKRGGNFSSNYIKRKNILSIVEPIHSMSQQLKMSQSEIIKRLNIVKSTLLRERGKREPPLVDKKVITGWNSMLATSLFQVSSKTGFTDAIDLAVPIIEYILTYLYVDGELYRSLEPTNPSKKPVLKGVLDDYAYFIEALITAYEYINDEHYLKMAELILKKANERFYEAQEKVYYFNENLNLLDIGRIISAIDDSFPSSIAIMISNLYKLGKYCQNQEYITKGQNLVESLVNSVETYEGAMNELLIASLYYLQDTREIVIIKPENKEFEQEVLSNYFSHYLIFRWREGDPTDRWEILEGKFDVEVPTVFICYGNTCSLPLTSIRDLREELKKL